MYKLRTMPPVSAGPQVTVGDDVRITPVGKFLRKTKLDELPELWNILEGEESLIGRVLKFHVMLTPKTHCGVSF